MVQAKNVLVAEFSARLAVTAAPALAILMLLQKDGLPLTSLVGLLAVAGYAVVAEMYRSVAMPQTESLTFKETGLILTFNTLMAVGCYTLAKTFVLG